MARQYPAHRRVHGFYLRTPIKRIAPNCIDRNESDIMAVGVSEQSVGLRLAGLVLNRPDLAQPETSLHLSGRKAPASGKRWNRT